MLADGTYLVKPDGSIENYGEKWAYGFFVGNGRQGHVTRRYGWLDLNVPVYNISRRWGSKLVGVWTDPDTGIVYIDPVDHVSDYETAVKLAQDRNEIAFWDAFKGECIKTPLAAWELELLGVSA